MEAIFDAGFSYQCIRYAERWMVYKEKARTYSEAVPTEVHWYHGETGTGKSRAAFTEAAASGRRVYVASGPGTKGGRWWFDGYDGHDGMIVDDFRPAWCSIEQLLRILDVNGVRIECKGGSRQMLAREIWITCPKHPAECYYEAGEDVEQLVRRISDVKEFT